RVLPLQCYERMLLATVLSSMNVGSPLSVLLLTDVRTSPVYSCCVQRISPWALSADVADERRMTASGYSPYGAEAQSGVSGVCRANNAMGVIRRCRG
ncbi:hypothetical protein, partial [Pseudomonas aeruginosa]|uniref:hypothetical protein n=1 Tax=Pseudomonas aeruginosa TaxID=287 RepID=UPI001C60F3C2